MLFNSLQTTLQNLKYFRYALYIFSVQKGFIMDRTEIDEQSEEQVSEDDLSEFQLRSLDIDIAFYENKLEKLKKTEF